MDGIEYCEMLGWEHLEGWYNARELLRRNIRAWRGVGIMEEEEDMREENENSIDDDAVIVVVGDNEKIEWRMM
jgi:hypothetical protein